ncbi:MAG: hypothetical protein WA816_05725 [Bacteroidales bacterium]
MKNDSISASSKIKELFDLHKSGILTNEEYYDQIISLIINQLSIRSLKQKETEKVSKKGISISIGKFKIDEHDLFDSETSEKGEVRPSNEKVQKILWTLLN